ncbi:PAS domain-containing protein [Paractinoplanes brasiliensis]|uniref:PAS domain S-box-containing protein n=1 Tax=Paractinoplanes brasiliensis TaxID=52695 RepID=A0A4R6JE06_9ACTN|nr:PAS domain-containing protein [Actinoplanes brasiliensis]TDO33201.1 PAS domain S-box-containing protein [Actinoplanes brasiliensis]GID33223.1 hypothetical protein Abr02nite_82060 [Actinoplanes brasiliensis]
MRPQTSPATHTHAYAARSIFEWTGACLARLDPQLRLVTANMDFFQQFGGTPGERRGKSLLDLVHPGARERVRRRFAALASSDRSHFTDHVSGLSGRGRSFSGTLTGVASRNSHGEIDAILVVVKPDAVFQGLDSFAQPA